MSTPTNGRCWQCGEPAYIGAHFLRPCCSNAHCHGGFYDPDVKAAHGLTPSHQESWPSTEHPLKPRAGGPPIGTLRPFQVGDLVRVRGDGPKTIAWNQEGLMDRFIGQTGRITGLEQPQGGVLIEGVHVVGWPNFLWTWHTDDLELVERAK